MITNINIVKELFKGFTVQRWNDKIRTVELIEMDKHAHKMFIAYILGKYEEQNGKKVNWDDIIKGGIFELLRRIIISDIKSPIFYKLKIDFKETFDKLNEWVYKSIESKFEDETIKKEFHSFLNDESSLDPFSMRILEASHIYSSYWEFLKIIKQANPEGYQINQIELDLLGMIDSKLDLVGMRKLITRRPVSDFIDLCGQLRFQTRWSQTPRLPKTSVLGHSLFVACVAYFFARDNNAGSKRIYNNFFGGLFHDLPEAVTRDIISPVKMSSEEFKNLIQDIEADLADKEILPLIEPSWRDEIKYFTRDEFNNKYLNEDGIICRAESTDEMNEKYNDDKYNPIDGQLIRAADQLAAYLEAWSSLKLGIKAEDLASALENIKTKYINKKLGSVDVSSIINKFESISV
jgi:putative hydrolase of HD superfamily